MSSVKAVTAVAFVVSLDKLLVANWLLTLLAHKAPLMVRLILIAHLLLSRCEFISAFFTSLRWCNTTAAVADELVILEGETLGKLLH